MLQLLPFSDCSVVLGGSEILALLGRVIVVSIVVMNQSLRFFFLTVSDYRSLHKIPWWAVGFPEEDNLFIYTTVYNNGKDNLIFPILM